MNKYHPGSTVPGSDKEIPSRGIIDIRNRIPEREGKEPLF
jgi:hypothetical protein